MVSCLPKDRTLEMEDRKKKKKKIAGPCPTICKRSRMPQHWKLPSTIAQPNHPVNVCVTLNQYLQYSIHPSNSLQDIRRNHWTMKCRSLTHIHLMRQIFALHGTSIPIITIVHHLVFKIWQNHWTMKYRSLTYIHKFRSVFVSHWTNISGIIFIQLVLKIMTKSMVS